MSEPEEELSEAAVERLAAEIEANQAAGGPRLFLRPTEWWYDGTREEFMAAVDDLYTTTNATMANKGAPDV